MKNSPLENTARLLREIRILLVLTILMVSASNMIDPPYSSFGIILNVLVVVVLVLILIRIHRSVVAVKSPPSIP